MEIPKHIDNIMQRILESEERWKANYMRVWGFATFNLHKRHYNTQRWDEERRFNLPASKQGYQKYSPAKLYSILTSKDSEFTFGHLQTLFSLLEELVTNLCPIICDGQEIWASSFKNLKKFLLGKCPYNKFQTNITEDDVQELKLAKVTRNKFIHNGSKVDETWLECYRETRGENSKADVNDNLPVNFHQIEDWHELIVSIVTEIKLATRIL